MDGSKGHVSKLEYNYCRDANSSQACSKSVVRNLQAIKGFGEVAAGGLSVREEGAKS